MQTYRALLIGNGEPVSPRRLQALARQADWVVAADAGADVALRCKVPVDAVIGDLDSLSPRARRTLADRLVYCPTQQNTDLEKALKWLLKHGVTHLTLVGFVGKRWDFSLGNVWTLAQYARKLSLCIAAENWVLYPLASGTSFSCKKGKRVSLLVLKPCREVTLTGLKFPLHRERLSPGTTRTLSNQTTATSYTVCFTGGLMLVYQEL